MPAAQREPSEPRQHARTSSGGFVVLPTPFHPKAPAVLRSTILSLLVVLAVAGCSRPRDDGAGDLWKAVIITRGN